MPRKGSGINEDVPVAVAGALRPQGLGFRATALAKIHDDFLKR